MTDRLPVVLSIDQAAEFMRIDPAEVRYLIKKRKIGCYTGPRTLRTLGARHVAEYLVSIDTTLGVAPTVDELTRSVEAWADGPRPPALPPSIAPRGLSREQAAEYVGLSPSAFLEQVRQGSLPGPTKFGRRSVWDRRALDLALDRRSQLAPGQQQGT